MFAGTLNLKYLRHPLLGPLFFIFSLDGIWLIMSICFSFLFYFSIGVLYCWFVFSDDSFGTNFKCLNDVGYSVSSSVVMQAMLFQEVMTPTSDFGKLRHLSNWELYEPLPSMHFFYFATISCIERWNYLEKQIFITFCLVVYLRALTFSPSTSRRNICIISYILLAHSCLYWLKKSSKFEMESSGTD